MLLQAQISTPTGDLDQMENAVDWGDDGAFFSFVVLFCLREKTDVRDATT